MHDDKVKAALAAMRARCEAATAGPWESVGFGADGSCVSTSTTTLASAHTHYPEGEDDGERIGSAQAYHNGAFIAAARTDLPKLLAVAEACAAMAEAHEAGDMAATLRASERMAAALAALGEP